LWTNPFWEGDTKQKVVKGEELGIKLYAGKKRMFKGHTWEKEWAKRVRRQRILMRDMKTRVERYKLVSFWCYRVISICSFLSLFFVLKTQEAAFLDMVL
jgi:hypothetical protein